MEETLRGINLKSGKCKANTVYEMQFGMAYDDQCWITIHPNSIMDFKYEKGYYKHDVVKVTYKNMTFRVKDYIFERHFRVIG